MARRKLEFAESRWRAWEVAYQELHEKYQALSRKQLKRECEDLRKEIAFYEAEKAEETEIGGAGNGFRAVTAGGWFAGSVSKVRADQSMRETHTLDTGRLDGKTSSGGSTPGRG